MPFPLIALAVGTAIAGAGVGAGIAASNLKGENYSEQITESILRNMIDASIKFVSEQSSSVDFVASGENELELDATGATIVRCVINIKQENNIKVRGDFTFDNNIQAKFRREIANSIELALENFNEQVNENLNFGQSNANIVKNDLLTENIIDVSQQFMLSFTSEFIARFTASNKAKYTFKDAYIECGQGLRDSVPFLNHEQINNLDIDITQVVRNTNVIDSVTVLTNNIVYEITNTNIQRNTGIDPLSFLGMLAGLGIFLSLAAAILKMLIKKAGGGSRHRSKYKALAGDIPTIIINTK